MNDETSSLQTTKVDSIIGNDESLMGNVEVSGDIRVNTLTIKNNTELVVRGNVTASFVYIGDSSTVCIEGSVNSRLCIGSHADILIQGSVMSTDTLNIKDDSIVIIQGSLEMSKTRDISIGNCVTLTINGYMNAQTSYMYECVTFNIGNKSKLTVKGSLKWVVMPSKEGKGWRTMSIGDEVNVLINGHAYLPFGVTIGKSTNIQVDKSADITCELTTGNTCYIYIKGSLKIHKWFTTGDDCEIDVWEEFICSNRATLGKRNDVKTPEMIGETYYTIGESTQIEVGKLIVSSRLVVGNDCQILCHQYFSVKDVACIGTDFFLDSHEIYIESSDFIVGNRATVRSSKLEFRIFVNPYGIVIGDDSSIEINELDIENSLWMGENIKLVCDTVKAKHITIGSNSKLEAKNLTADRTVIINDCFSNGGSLCIGKDSSILVTSKMESDVTYVGSRTQMTLGTFTRMNKVWTQPMTRIEMKGPSEIKQLYLYDSLIIGHYNTRINSIRSRSSQSYFIESLNCDSIHLDDNSSLLVTKSLITRSMVLDDRQTIGVENKAFNTTHNTFINHDLLKRMTVTTRLLVGEDAYIISNVKGVKDKEVIVMNDLYTDIRLGQLPIEVGGTQKTNDKQTLETKLRDIRKLNGWN